jgi:hypothetical protein
MTKHRASSLRVEALLALGLSAAVVGCSTSGGTSGNATDSNVVEDRACFGPTTMCCDGPVTISGTTANKCGCGDYNSANCAAVKGNYVAPSQCTRPVRGTASSLYSCCLRDPGIDPACGSTSNPFTYICPKAVLPAGCAEQSSTTSDAHFVCCPKDG